MSNLIPQSITTQNPLTGMYGASAPQHSATSRRRS